MDLEPGTTASELRATTAVPAIVEGRHGGDGECRNRVVGVGRRLARERSLRPVPCSCWRSDSASTLAIGWRSPSAAALVLARRTMSGAPSCRFGRRGGGCGIRCRGAGVETSTRWRSHRPASRSRDKDEDVRLSPSRSGARTGGVAGAAASTVVPVRRVAGALSRPSSWSEAGRAGGGRGLGRSADLCVAKRECWIVSGHCRRAGAHGLIGGRERLK